MVQLECRTSTGTTKCEKIIELDEDKKSTMVSNLLVVLCSETDNSCGQHWLSVIDRQIFPC